MRRILSRLASDKTGVTTVEYALIAALIAIATATGIGLLSPSIVAVLKSASEAAPSD